LGRTDDDLCPVTVILYYMVYRGALAGPFFTFEDGRFLTRDRYVTAFRAALTASGVESNRYAAHSFSNRGGNYDC